MYYRIIITTWTSVTHGMTYTVTHGMTYTMTHGMTYTMTHGMTYSTTSREAQYLTYVYTTNNCIICTVVSTMTNST